MDWLSSFLKLEYKHVWLCISGFLGTVAAGFLVIFQFKPELVEQYDVFKLLILSLGLTLPVLFFNTVPISFFYNELPDDYENETAKNVDITRGALLLNAMVFYFALLICHFASLKFKWFLVIITGLEFLLLICSMAVWVILKNAKK